MRSKAPAKAARKKKVSARRRVGAPTTTAAAGPNWPRNGGTPPSAPPTSSADSRQILTLLAEKEHARRVLRETGDPWRALRVLGLVNSGTKVGHSRTELVHLAGRYINFATASSPPNGGAYPRLERLDLIFQAAANDEPWPREAMFEPSKPVPMSREDAVSEIATMRGVSRKVARDLIRRGLILRAQAGLDTIPLPDGRKRRRS